MICLNLQSNDQHPSRYYRCYIITFVIIEAVMAAQSSFEFVCVWVGGWWEGGGGRDVIFNITEGR